MFVENGNVATQLGGLVLFSCRAQNRFSPNEGVSPSTTIFTAHFYCLPLLHASFPEDLSFPLPVTVNVVGRREMLPVSENRVRDSSNSSHPEPLVLEGDFSGLSIISEIMIHDSSLCTKFDVLREKLDVQFDVHNIKCD